MGIRRLAAATLLAVLVAPLAAPSRASAAPGAALGPADARVARLDSLLRRYQEVGAFNGTALVAENGRVLVEKGYGLADIEQSVPLEPDTRIWIGSVTKVFTATMILRLVDEGRLRLDDHVSDVLPWYRRDTGGRMTIRQLLQHTSGLPDYMHLPGIGREGFRRETGDDPIEVRAFAERWCSADLAWEPGSRWGYSNSGYFLLGAIVEAATGTSYEEALRRLVLEPAGMHDTGDLAAQPRRIVPRLAQGYERNLGALVTRRPWNLSTAFGAGAMYSTVGDLERFDRALDREGFLSPAAREAMFTPGVGGYGCGWEIRDMPIGPDRVPRRVATHEGFIFWAMARVYRVPEERLFVALLNNTGDAPLDSMFVRLADVLHGRAVVWPRPSAAEAVHAIAVERGGSAAVDRYRELAARASDRYEFTERGLNQLGYRLMGEGRSPAAVEIFTLMTESYPASANAFDSLGEGLAALGRRDEAIAAYRRSLELDPANRNAADRIERLRSVPTQPAPLR